LRFRSYEWKKKKSSPVTAGTLQVAAYFKVRRSVLCDVIRKEWTVYFPQAA